MNFFKIFIICTSICTCVACTFVLTSLSIKLIIHFKKSIKIIKQNEQSSKKPSRNSRSRSKSINANRSRSRRHPPAKLQYDYENDIYVKSDRDILRNAEIQIYNNENYPIDAFIYTSDEPNQYYEHFTNHSNIGSKKSHDEPKKSVSIAKFIFNSLK